MIVLPRPNAKVLYPCNLKGLDYQIDPYVGCEHFCYYCYVLPQAETDWKKEIFRHDRVVEQLSEELEGIPAQTIYLGWHTDPYQPCEFEEKQTRQILEVLVKKGFSASILTKSDLVLRDLDLFIQMPDPMICFSIAFDNETDRERFEYKTVSTKSRVDALSELKRQGIKTSAMLCPIMPYITNTQKLIERLVPCVDLIWIYGLSILDRTNPNWYNIEQIFAQHYPDLKTKIEKVVFDRNHSYWKKLRDELEILKEKCKVDLDIHV